MHVAATPEQAGTILGAMLAVASSGGTPTEADRASIAAAGRYIFKLDLSPDLAGLTPPGAEALRKIAADAALADEAVRFATVMAFVDGLIDEAKLRAVLKLAAVLGVRADFVEDVTQLARGHLRNATSHMIRANLESVTGRPWNTLFSVLPACRSSTRWASMSASSIW
jgi:tellurite resistance protein